MISFKKSGGGSSRVAHQDAMKKDVLPSHVRLLDFIHFCAYSAPREHAGVTLDVDIGRIHDSSCIPGGHELVGPKHDLAVGWVGPMVMMDILRGGGVGLMAVSRMVHDYWGGGSGGRGGQSFGR